MIDSLITDGMSIVIYIHIDINVICVLIWTDCFRKATTSDSSHFFLVDKKQLFNGIIGWCIGLHVDCHSSQKHRTALQTQKAIYMIYDHLT